MHIVRIFAAFAIAPMGAWVGATWAKGPTWDAIGGLIIALGAYLALEYQDQSLSGRLDRTEREKGRLSEHDAALGAALSAIFSAGTQTFLREHSFYQPYHTDRTSGLEDLAFGWKGVDFRFDDDALQGLLEAIMAANEALVSKLERSVYVADNYPPTHYAVSDQRERGDDLYSLKTKATVDEIHGLTKTLLEAYDAFKGEFRKRPKPIVANGAP